MPATNRTSPTAILIAAAAALTAACASRPANVTSRMTNGFDAQVVTAFERVRAATARFVSLDSAVAAGYPREVTQCIAHESHGTMGAMGFHHVKRAIVDTALELERPEILLYEKRPDGTYRLNGVEFIIPYRLWPRDSTPPRLMGLDLKREDNLRLWYLHMWTWTENPAGLFADYNPAVACPKT
jgi:hypothetical protein